MSFRVSFILLVLLAVVGGYVVFYELQQKPKSEPNPPWFYDVAFDEITAIQVEYQGQRQSFASTPDGWGFSDTGQPVDYDRWGGVQLLLTGPRSARLAAEHIDNPRDYGLNPALTTIVVTLKSGQQITTLLGEKTPDGSNHYAQVLGQDSLFLITSAWGDVINRLVTEPPILPPTPTPAPEAEATPTAS
ncbi:MAG: hypothetical protein HY680_02170 [Chloroflexi bacterium]|nr:hypothetical protein [Chloroflexota bacterium]